MNIHSETYKRIRNSIVRTWPAWKRKIYNSCLAVSAHAEKIPEDDCTRSTPVWTNYDRLISKTPEEMAAYLADHPIVSDYDASNPQHAKWLAWLKSPADKEKTI